MVAHPLRYEDGVAGIVLRHLIGERHEKGPITRYDVNHIDSNKHRLLPVPRSL